MKQSSIFEYVVFFGLHSARKHSSVISVVSYFNLPLEYSQITIQNAKISKIPLKILVRVRKSNLIFFLSANSKFILANNFFENLLIFLFEF